MKGDTLQGVTPESIRMFALCDAMKWNHLPIAGGLYNQHPQLLDDFFYIFQQRAAHDAEEANKQKQNMGKQSVARSTTARRAGRRGR